MRAATLHVGAQSIRLETVKDLARKAHFLQPDRVLMEMHPTLGLNFRTCGTRAGVEVVSAPESGAAAAFGVKVGDVIHKVNGISTTTHAEFAAVCQRAKVGDNIHLVGWREEHRLDISMVVGARGVPLDHVLDLAHAKREHPNTSLQAQLHAIEPVSSLHLKDSKKGGVKILKLEAHTAAENAGLKKNDVIQLLGQAPIMNKLDFWSQFRSYRAGDVVLAKVLRKGVKERLEMYLTISGAAHDLDELENMADQMRLSTPTRSLCSMRRSLGVMFYPATGPGAGGPKVRGGQPKAPRRGPGLRVREVLQGTSVFAAGIQAGDTLTHVNDMVIQSTAMFWAHFHHTFPGDSMRWCVRRGNSRVVINVIVGAKGFPLQHVIYLANRALEIQQTPRRASPVLAPQPRKGVTTKRARELLTDMNPAAGFMMVVAQASTSAGLLITQVAAEGSAEEAGLIVGDILMQFAEQRVLCEADFFALWANVVPGDEIPMQVEHADGSASVLTLTVGGKGHALAEVRRLRAIAGGQEWQPGK